MKTTVAPVIYGFSPNGGTCFGKVRFVIPENYNPSTIRSAIKRGSCAIHGAGSIGQARIGQGFRLIFRQGSGWRMEERIIIVRQEEDNENQE